MFQLPQTRLARPHRKSKILNKKGPPAAAGEPCEKRTDYLAPRIASLAALATRNFTTRLAGIWICSPVAGLRPMRALRFTSTSLPRPGSVKVFFAFLYARSARGARISVACFFLSPAFSAIAAASWDLDIEFAIVFFGCCFVCVKR